LCFVATAFTLFSFFHAHGQSAMDARNGWAISPEGRLHVLLIFAEINFDGDFAHLDPIAPEGTKDWKPRKIPWWKDKLFSKEPDGNSYMTKFFRQASFGKFQVTGDYLDTIITIDISSVKDRSGRVVTEDPYGNGYFRSEVVRRAAKMPFRTGFGSVAGDFDRWELTTTGMQKINKPNGNFDMVMIIWRNIHVRNLGDNSGFVSPGDIGKIHQDMGTDSYSMFRMSNFVPLSICRHEFSHMLYGGNNFHNASGGVGTHTFICGLGGWSNMSNDARCSDTWNVWDRERLGWKNPDNQFLVTARDGITMTEISGELSYGKPLPNEKGHFVLRDFVSTGDALKIKLPGLTSPVNNQYLWIENHQRIKGWIDFDQVMIPGMYAFITVGKDELTGSRTFGGNNNYGFPLVAAGNYDFSYPADRTNDKRIFIDSDRPNAFTGYHLLMSHANDLDGNGEIVLGAGRKEEIIFPNGVVKDGVEMTEEFFDYKTYPVYGNTDIAFTPQRYHKIGIGYNPAAVPVYSHSNPGGPREFDNRRIYLNGISIEFQRTDESGNIHLKIRWEDFDIVNNVRWCGNIVSNEKINLFPGRMILLDQGYSPQVTKIQNLSISDSAFAEPSVLELRPGSETTLDRWSSIRVQGGSSLLVRAGSKLTLRRGAKIIIAEGSFLWIEKGSVIELERGAGFQFTKSQVGMHSIVSPQFNDRISHVDPPSK